MSIEKVFDDGILAVYKDKRYGIFYFYPAGEEPRGDCLGYREVLELAQNEAKRREYLKWLELDASRNNTWSTLFYAMGITSKGGEHSE